MVAVHSQLFALLFSSTNTFFLSFFSVPTINILLIPLNPALASSNPWLSFFIYLFFLFILIPSHFCLCFLIFFPPWSILSNTYWCPTNSHTTPINTFFKNTVYSHLIHHPSHACVSSLSVLPPHGLNVLQGPAGTATASLSQPGEEPQQRRSFLVFKHPAQEDNRNNTGRFHQPMTKYLGNNICEQKATQIIVWRKRPFETVTLIVCFLKN